MMGDELVCLVIARSRVFISVQNKGILHTWEYASQIDFIVKTPPTNSETKWDQQAPLSRIERLWLCLCWKHPGGHLRPLSGVMLWRLFELRSLACLYFSIHLYSKIFLTSFSQCWVKNTEEEEKKETLRRTSVLPMGNFISRLSHI